MKACLKNMSGISQAPVMPQLPFVFPRHFVFPTSKTRTNQPMEESHERNREEYDKAFTKALQASNNDRG